MVDYKLLPEDADLRGNVAILIPAYNEEATVAQVIRAAKGSKLGPVLVIDDGSQDDTTKKALAEGVSVLRLELNVGKAGAVWLAAKLVKTDIIVLLDADLVGLNSKHVQALAAPVLQAKADMSRGSFSGGRFRTTAAQKLTPQLNGQRAILRHKLLELDDFSKARYGIEIAISKGAKKHGWKTANVDLPGVSQVMKEEKRGFRQGLKIRLAMYRDIFAALLR